MVGRGWPSSILLAFCIHTLFLLFLFFPFLSTSFSYALNYLLWKYVTEVCVYFCIYKSKIFFFYYKISSEWDIFSFTLVSLPMPSSSPIGWLLVASSICSYIYPRLVILNRKNKIPYPCPRNTGEMKMCEKNITLECISLLFNLFIPCLMPEVKDHSKIGIWKDKIN